VVHSANGFEIGRVAHKPDAVVITLPRDGSERFGLWLA
jgi:hypothetical protein